MVVPLRIYYDKGCPDCGRGVIPMGYIDPETGKEATHLCLVCQGIGRTSHHQEIVSARRVWFDQDDDAGDDE
jgi:hypothetical protein